ncbi:hypothetical protein GRF29_96g349053 [Pseudopithomyces chartarum]|uniref:Uncharacterized protein n=1 Tax=Pseudopithomyces chartarum TaxID=1892770 RepID=A0AAN6LYP7_9PLEO|nr:hypothetical protein GRF29_96g349053 [Pseudopithomyces chartarum]
MFSKLSIFALVTASAFTTAAPTDTSVAPAVFARQSFWKLYLYTSGCDDEETEYFSGTDQQEFQCTGSVTGWHNAKMENIAANGLKVMLYSDGGCLNKIGEVSRDGTCYSAPSDTVISAYGIVKA